MGDPIAEMIIGGDDGGGGGSSSQQTITGKEQWGTPHLFEPHSQFLAETGYGSNEPIYNPDAMLNAYMRNMPAFLRATQTSDISKPEVKTPTTGNNTGFGGPSLYEDPAGFWNHLAEQIYKAKQAKPNFNNQ